MNKQTKSLVLNYYKKFLRLSNTIQWYNYRDFSKRKLKYDFSKIYSSDKVDSNLEQKLKDEYEKFQRIIIVQNLYSGQENIEK